MLNKCIYTNMYYEGSDDKLGHRRSWSNAVYVSIGPSLISRPYGEMGGDEK